MGKKHGRRPKAIIPPSVLKVRVSTRDSACSPVPELHTESTVCTEVSRSTLPRIKTVDLNRSQRKSVKMEFVATRVGGVVSITAKTAAVDVKFSMANLDWQVLLYRNRNREISCNLRSNEKIHANQWKVIASLELVFSGSEDRKQVLRLPSLQFDSDQLSRWWHNLDDNVWRPLVTIPENDDETIRTVLYVKFVLTIEEMFGFRLRQSFTYDFHEANKDSDLVFRFNDDDVYINCSFLSLHSDYFSATKDRLSTMKKNENGFPYEEMDVDMDEFIELMEIVYPSRRKVTDENVSFVLHLADRFLFEGVLRECEEFLMSTSSKTDIFVKLLWSSEYVMNDLQEWCFTQFKTRAEINAVIKSEHYKALKKTGTIMTALFEKLASFPN